uniref:Porcine reproductive and respiratory syndrome virus 2b n=1 Tax=Myoviridae sp. ctJ2i1 TaxID=2825079 RepID=A0A8S5V2G1_9CAUD|nr:MAG TPA: Porcine reproductive and respiratory syndrome virus 2b [Myoviridae sp. ctJ2i1]
MLALLLAIFLMIYLALAIGGTLAGWDKKDE